MQLDGSVQDNPHTLTPSINRLMSEGIKLTGRYPWGVGYYDMKGPEAIPLGFKLVSNLLADAGYETHAIGKWNLGSKIKPYTPTRRGFSTFFGYYAACQVDYWYHGAGPQECGQKGVGGHDGIPLHVGNITDLSNSSAATDIQPARGFNGTYNEEMFTAEAERLIAKHATGLRSGEIAAGAGFYLYLAYHNVHGATNDLASQQAPQATVDLYNTTKLDTYKVAGAQTSVSIAIYTKRPDICQDRLGTNMGYVEHRRFCRCHDHQTRRRRRRGASGAREGRDVLQLSDRFLFRQRRAAGPRHEPTVARR
eukprot:COSAG06_NODE_4589_length_4122_cov_1.697241_3_plen_308_part_00